MRKLHCLCPLLALRHTLSRNPETLATVEKHLSNLRKHDAHALPQDYADDAIILTNLSERPYHGTAAIEYYCSNLLEKPVWKLML